MVKTRNKVWIIIVQAWDESDWIWVFIVWACPQLLEGLGGGCAGFVEKVKFLGVCCASSSESVWCWAVSVQSITELKGGWVLCEMVLKKDGSERRGHGWGISVYMVYLCAFLEGTWGCVYV